MSQIISQIYRDKLPRGQLYPIKYSDLEACFFGRSADDVYLDVHFSRDQAYWKEEREEREAQGSYDLVNLHFPLDRASWREEGKPWKGIENATIVSASIRAIPAHVAMMAGFRRVYFSNLLVEQVHRLAPIHLPWPRWHLRVILLAPDRIIECLSTQWTGLRKEPEVQKVISLDSTTLSSIESAPSGRRRIT